MNTVTERQTRLIAEFARLPGWEDRYKHLIELGKKLPPLAPEFRDEKYKVRGCQSQVWLHAKMDDQGRMQIQADSDALIVKGLVALLLETFSGTTPDEVLASSPNFIKDLGFEGHLSPSRANGLYAMLKQIYYYATAFRAMAQAKTNA